MTEHWPQLELAQPWWLAALVVLPLLVYYGRRSLARFSRWRQRASLAVRMVIVVLVVLALSGPRITRPTREKFVVFAVDRSASVGAESRQTAEPFLEEAALPEHGGRSAVVRFGREPVVSATEEPPGDGTDLASAIETAAAIIPGDFVPQIVLMTDGLAARRATMLAAQAAGVPIWTVPLEARADPEVYVAAVEAPEQVREGEPFSAGVVVYASSEGRGSVTLEQPGGSPQERTVEVVPGENRIRFSEAVVGQGLVPLAVRLEGFADTIAENNRATASVFATPKPKVLLVESEPRLVDRFREALEGRQIETVVRRPEEFPRTPAELAGFELVCLSNVPAAALSQEQMEMIRHYVRDEGGGLVAVGGDRSFTPGGYLGTTLEDVLPVVSEFEPKVERRSLALVLVIDRSGSMQGEAIELAKQATRRAVETLDPRDQVGVIAFENTARWVSRLQPCTDKGPVLDEIATIRAGGGTALYPAMDMAYLALDDAFAELKHVIVLSDGVSHPGDFDALVRRMAERGITVSTVGVGREAAGDFLADVAARGGGDYYHCDDPAEVPQIFELETRKATRQGVIEEPFRPRLVGPVRDLEGFDFAAAPPLLGYIETKAKPGSRVVLASEAGHPILAWWRDGRGTAVAFTSDIQSRWATAWLRWEGFPRFWERVLRLSMREDETRDFALRVDRDGDGATVTLDAIDPEGRFLNGADVTLEVADPDGGKGTVSVPQVAPGRYAVTLGSPKPGKTGLELTVKNGGRTVYTARRAVHVDFPDELRTRPADRELLREIADATGGRFDPKPAEVFAPSATTVPRTVFLWPHLLLAAALAFVLDVGLRRVVR